MIERLSYLIELFVIFYMYNKLFGKKMKADIITVLFFSSDIAILVMINEYGAPKIISLIMYILTFAYLILEFRVSIKEAIKKYIMGLVIMSLLQFTVSAVTFMLLDRVLQNEINILLINSVVFVLVVVMFRLNIISGVVKQLVEFKNYRFLVALLITMCVAVFIFFKSQGDIEITYFLQLSAFAMLIIYDSLLWYKEKTKIEIEKRELQMQKIYGDAFSDLISDIRRKQHNFDNHIQALSGMYLTVSSLEELAEKQKEYREKMINDSKYNKIINEKSSPVIMGFLYHKFLKAEESGIRISQHIVIEEAKSRLSQYELVEILGVIFDNAMEAVENLEDDKKEILFEMIEYKDKIAIKIENVCENLGIDKIGLFFREGYSTKGKTRGLGLAGVKKLIENCEGKIATEILKKGNKEWFSLSLDIDK